MKTYLVGGTYVATQEHAKQLAKQRGCGWRREDVPTDSEGLLRYLNALRAAGQFAQQHAEQEKPIVHHDHDTSALSVSAATRILSELDAPGANVEAIVETILKSKGYALGRFANAVAVAFGKLGGR